MKVMVIGADGQLGTDLSGVLPPAEVIPLTHQDIEITDMESVRTVCTGHRPDVIINTAAYVRVDECETNPDKAFRVNALGARNVTVVAQELGAKMVYISTDYVFGGEAETHNNFYTEFDNPVPISVYGKSKLAGEDFVQHLCSKYFIIRTSGLFGVAGSSGKGGNFVETMLKLAGERDELRVVSDQIFSPTYACDLAGKINQLINTDYYGLFHVTNSGACSWFEFATEILKLADLRTPVIPISSNEYPQKAKRPHSSVLGNYHLKLLGMDDMRPWQDALRDYVKETGVAPLKRGSDFAI